MSEPKKLHVALFPWLAFGHLIPYLELAKLIAQKGHKISFVSTPRNIQRLPKIPSVLLPHINFVSLTLPQVESLPENAESTMDLTVEKIPFLEIAFDGLKDPVFRFLKRSSPDWTIYDFAPYWLPPITANLGILGAHFSIFSAWSLSFFGPYSQMINGDDPRDKPEEFTVPPDWVPFPSKVAFRYHEAKHCLDYGQIMKDSGVSDLFRYGRVLEGCDAIAFRSCNELEADFLKLFGELQGKIVFPIGLLPPSASICCNEDKDDAWIGIKEWVDKKEKGSVIYIAFGSEAELRPNQLTELALGLELSGLPFIWKMKKGNNNDSIRLPDGFEERVKGQGLISTNWVPQLKILGHESVGGFLTHCGYSSVIEALHFGLALVMLPLSIDQGLISRVFEDKRVGVEIERDEQNGSFTRDSVAKALRMVIVENEGIVYRKNAKEMMKLFADTELHNRYIGHFVEFMQNQVKDR